MTSRETPPARSVYMDNHATTQVDPIVLDAMLPFFSTYFGNPASRQHRWGWAAQKGVETAREEVASLLGAHPADLVFTSGATESNNLAIKGAARLLRPKGTHLITVATEHPSVRDACRALEQEGFRVTMLGVDRDGRIDPQQVEDAIDPQTILVSVMTANNEVGTIQPIARIGAICRAHRVLLHTDATQAAGKIPFDVEAMNVDLASISAHKMYGPKGVGALYVRRNRPRVRLTPLLDGGGHERGLRSGTLNVPGIVGLGKAAALCAQRMNEEAARVGALRDRLHRGLDRRLTQLQLNGHPTERLPGNLNLSFACVEGEALMMRLPQVAISSGSACTSATLEPSHVLRAMGVDDELAHSSIRFGLGRFNTQDEVDDVIEWVGAAVDQIRAISPRWRERHAGVTDLAGAEMPLK